ncbi:MAG: hypothetical protein JSR73_03745 [Proteobacteria bacterium]|nr:hypothetical protein [Pseudomonadota bacterium]
MAARPVAPAAAAQPALTPVPDRVGGPEGEWRPAPSGRFAQWRELFGLLAEWRFARRTCRELLRRFEAIRRDEPALDSRATYLRVLQRRASIDQAHAQRTLRKAEQSFTDWLPDRELRYRDVVTYVVFEEYSRRFETRLGTRTQIQRVVARIIPANY